MKDTMFIVVAGLAAVVAVVTVANGDTSLNTQQNNTVVKPAAVSPFTS